MCRHIPEPVISLDMLGTLRFSLSPDSPSVSIRQQPDHYSRTFASPLRHYRERSVMRLDDGLHDRQTYAHAWTVGFAGMFATVEERRADLG